MNSTFYNFDDADEVRSVYAFEGTEYDNDDVKSVYAFDYIYNAELFGDDCIGCADELQQLYEEVYKLAYGSKTDDVESVYAFEAMANDFDDKDEVESVYAFESVEDVSPEVVPFEKFCENVSWLFFELMKAFIAFHYFLYRGLRFHIFLCFAAFRYHYNQIPESYKLLMAKKSQPIKKTSAKPTVKEVANDNVKAAVKK